MLKLLNPAVFNKFNPNYFNKYAPYNDPPYLLIIYISPISYFSSSLYSLPGGPPYIFPNAPPIYSTGKYNSGYGYGYSGGFPKPPVPISNYPIGLPNTLPGSKYNSGAPPPLPPPPDPSNNIKNIPIYNLIKYFKKKNIGTFNPF